MGYCTRNISGMNNEIIPIAKERDTDPTLSVLIPNGQLPNIPKVNINSLQYINNNSKFNSLLLAVGGVLLITFVITQSYCDSSSQ